MIIVKGTRFDIRGLKEPDSVLLCNEGAYHYVESGIVENEIRVLENFKTAERPLPQSAPIHCVTWDQGTEIPQELGDYTVAMDKVDREKSREGILAVNNYDRICAESICLETENKKLKIEGEYERRTKEQYLTLVECLKAKIKIIKVGDIEAPELNSFRKLSKWLTGRSIDTAEEGFGIGWEAALLECGEILCRPLPDQDNDQAADNTEQPEDETKH